MTKGKTKKQIQAEEKHKDFLIKIIAVIGIVLFLGIFIQNVKADTITHKFKSPSFNGVGTSSHYLTIENQEYTRKLTIKEEIKALQDEIEREKECNRNRNLIPPYES